MGAPRVREVIKGQMNQGEDSPAPGRGNKTFLARSFGTHQPEIMLPWLTLILLCSTACWADEMYGKRGRGRYFSISPDSENDITGIRVSISPMGIVRSIQVRYGSSWSEQYGIAGGRSQKFTLSPGEHIVKVFGSYNLYLQCLIFYTDSWRRASFGICRDHNFIAHSDLNEKVLRGVFGQIKPLGISSIGFTWDYPVVVVSTEPPSTT